MTDIRRLSGDNQEVLDESKVAHGCLNLRGATAMRETPSMEKKPPMREELLNDLLRDHVSQLIEQRPDLLEPVSFLPEEDRLEFILTAAMHAIVAAAV